ADVRIVSPSLASGNTYYKFGPTPSEQAPHWYRFMFDDDFTTGAEFVGSEMILHLVDGKRGDDDLSDNGIIADPAAIAFNAQPQVSAGSDQSLNEGKTLLTFGSFTDNEQPVFSATVNYGDGSGTSLLTLRADNTFSLSHFYTDSGIYVTTVC